MIPENIFPHFVSELEKVASVGRARALSDVISGAKSRFKVVSKSLGLKRFIPFTQASKDRAIAKEQMHFHQARARRELEGIEGDARARALGLGPDAEEQAATVRAARLAKRGKPIPGAFSPTEQAEEKAQEASNRFKTKALVGGTALAGGAAYLATRRPQEDVYAE